MQRLGPWRVVIGICCIGSMLLAAGARAADTTMFDEGRAQRAFEAIGDKVGHRLRVLSLVIHADDLTVVIPDADTPGQVETWQVSQKGVLGFLGANTPILRGTGRASIISGSLEENLIDVDANALAIVPKLAADSLARARMQTPSKVSEMELRRLPKIVEPGVRDPDWLVHVEGVGEDADISAKMTGEITVADLNHTLRSERLDLLAGGPDFDEMIQDIRTEIKNDWTFHYIEIGKQAIQFDVTLNSLADRARMTRFTATLGDIKTYDTSLPHSGFARMRADPPFEFGDIDWSMLTKVEQAAKDRLQITDGVVQSVSLTKPERVTGGGIEWEVRIRSAKAPLFVGLNSPPVEEGIVGFDMKGTIVRTKYPEGHGPKINLFDAAALQKAIETIRARLGAHLLVSELLISTDSIDITAQDPKEPKKFAIFTYKDDDVTRASDVRAQIANALGAGPDWLWDLALLQPAVLQPLASLEQQTMAKTGVGHGTVTRITISKDKMFHASNDRPLIEIRVAGDDNNDQWRYFDFAGNLADPDQPSAGARQAPSTGANRDEQDCTGSDPERVIAGCTRMTQNRNESAHNRAIAFYNRGGIYKDRGDYDRAINDYNEAIKLDPQYANAYLNRGFAYASKSDSDHALADFDRAIELNPQESVTYLDRGIVRNGKANYDGAIADFAKALELGLKEQAVYFNRGLAYQRKSDCRHAIADYSEAVKLKPDATTFTNRGLCFQVLKDADHAVADFTAAIKLDAKYVNAYSDRGYLHWDKGEIDAAIADYNSALELQPNLSRTSFNRGLAYRAKSDFDHAITDFDAAIKADPKYAAAYNERGFIYFLTGSLPKSLADLSQANALDPAEAYAALWLDIVGQKSKLQSNLAQTSAKLDMTVWPAPVVRLFLGQMTSEAVLAASDDPDPTIKRGHICETNFYTGELALLHDDRETATRLFSAATGDCPSSWSEWEAADAELKSLGMTPGDGKR
ncbi:MAG TPA: tetratricopeptide repeat protein [Stellaceae bacterium]|nr:tetratricopeptide repeat protein [Stellaceae bacterium]